MLDNKSPCEKLLAWVFVAVSATTSPLPTYTPALELSMPALVAPDDPSLLPAVTQYLGHCEGCRVQLLYRVFFMIRQEISTKNSEMSQTVNLKLSRFERQPWGFRLHGGTDFGTPLLIQKVVEKYWI